MRLRLSTSGLPLFVLASFFSWNPYSVPTPRTKVNQVAVTYDVHEREEVVLHVLLAVKTNHRVIDSQQDFDVVVALPSITAPAPADRLIDLPGHRVERPGYVQLWVCTGSRILYFSHKITTHTFHHIGYKCKNVFRAFMLKCFLSKLTL